MIEETINAQDWQTLAPHFAALASEDLTAEGVGDWLLRWSELEKELGEAGARASRAKSEDTTDAQAEAAYLHFVQEIIPQWTVAAQALKTKLLAVPGYEPVPEHHQFLRRLRSDADLFRAENVPLQAQLQTLANEYNKLTGSMTVTLDGEEMTLPQAEGRLLDPDRSVRESAWRAVQERWLETRAPLDALYLQMLPLRRQLAKNAGMADYRAYMWRAMKRFDYTPEDSLAFGRAIETEVVPLAKRLLESRRQTLGVEALRPWDLAADPENRAPLRPFADVAELEEGTARIFANVDPDLGADFEKFRRGYLDPRLAQGQVARRLLLVLSQDRPALHLHERRRDRRRRPHHAPRGRPCLPRLGVERDPAPALEPGGADGVQRGRLDGDGAAGAPLSGEGQGRVLHR